MTKQNENITLSANEAYFIADLLKDIMKYEGAKEQDSKEDWKGYWLNNMWITPSQMRIIKRLMKLAL